MKLNLCFCEIFHSLIGQLDLLGNLVPLFSGVVSVDTLDLAVCRIPDGTVGDGGI